MKTEEVAMGEKGFKDFGGEKRAQFSFRDNYIFFNTIYISYFLQ